MKISQDARMSRWPILFFLFLLLLVHPVFWYSISLYPYIFTYEGIWFPWNVNFSIQCIITPWEIVIIMFWPSQYQSFYCFVGYFCHSVVDVYWHFGGDVDGGGSWFLWRQTAWCNVSKASYHYKNWFLLPGLPTAIDIHINMFFIMCLLECILYEIVNVLKKLSLNILHALKTFPLARSVKT